jgi:nucleoid-associated protein YgaU
VSQQPRCRSWLESTLLSLERRGVISATREHRPPHYHVSVFPRQYARYVASLGDAPTPSATPARAATASAASVASAARLAHALEYRVRRGDSLWSIARRHGLDVDTLKTVNRLNTTRIYAGQTLQIPAQAR